MPAATNAYTIGQGKLLPGFTFVPVAGSAGHSRFLYEIPACNIFHKKDLTPRQ